MKSDPKLELYNADCLDILRQMPAEMVDLILTDPPYGIAYQNRAGKTVLNDERPFIWWLYDAYRVTRDPGALVCFCRWDVQEVFRQAISWAGWRVRSQVIWDKGVHGMGDTAAQFAPMHEVAWFATKGRYRFPGKRPKSVLSVRRILSGQVHPTQKPVELMGALIDAVAPPGAVVCDPFMGSGPVWVACRERGLHFIGIEEDEEWFRKCGAMVNMGRPR